MMPRPGIVGVDVDSQAYEDLVHEKLGQDHTPKGAAWRILRREVYRRLRRIGQYGFGDY